MDIAALIAATREGRSFRDLAKDNRRSPSQARWQNLAMKPQREFLAPETIRGVAQALHVTNEAVVSAMAETLNLIDKDARATHEARVLLLIPPEFALLSDVQVSAVRQMIRGFAERGQARQVEGGYFAVDLTDPDDDDDKGPPGEPTPGNSGGERPAAQRGSSRGGVEPRTRTHQTRSRPPDKSPGA